MLISFYGAVENEFQSSEAPFEQAKRVNEKLLYFGWGGHGNKIVGC